MLKIFGCISLLGILLLITRKRTGPDMPRNPRRNANDDSREEFGRHVSKSGEVHGGSGGKY